MALPWDDSHLHNFIHKYYHHLRLESLTQKEAAHLIESLKNVKRINITINLSV